MKKRIFAALLAAAMTVGFVSCDNGSSDNNTGNESTPASTAASDSGKTENTDNTETGDPAAEAIAARTETKKIVVSWFTWTGAPGGLDRIEAAMNELTVPALNLEVEMQVTDYASRNQQLTLQISGGEQLDIVNSLGVGYTTGIQADYWEDLEQEVDGYNLIETYGKDLIDTMGWDILDACRSADGILYGVSQQKENAQGRFALSIRTECLEAAAAYMDLVPDLESDVWRVDGGIADLVTILKATHDANPNMDTFCPNSGSSWTRVDSLGGDYFGVQDNYGQGEDAKTVKSYFDCDSYLEMVNSMRELYTYGCINPSDLTDTTAASSRVMANSLCSYITNYKPGSKIQESTLCGTDVTIVLAGPDFTGSTSIAAMPWCICSNTDDVVAAMQYMNFMYSSSEWNELFKWGEKDVDFEEIDGTAKFVENAEYNHAVQWLAPGQFLAMPEYGNPTNLWDVYEEFNNNAIVTENSGFAFDKAPVVNEFTAISNVYNEYQKSIEYGTVDPEPAIAEMKEKMSAAGLDIYIAEKQSQLDAWRVANGK